jgi:hypothetical protein
LIWVNSRSEATKLPSSKVALTLAAQKWCDAVTDHFVLGAGLMDDAVDRVMASYENLPALERLGREEIRMKVSQYLEKLSSAGHSDAEELTFYGLAYLRILNDGPDSRYTGC